MKRDLNGRPGGFGSSSAPVSNLKKFLFVGGAFLLGAIIVLIPCVIVIARNSKNCSTASETTATTEMSTTTKGSKPSSWNESDYQSNSDYYQKLEGGIDFNQTHNLRLDRLSSPKLNPIDGKSVIYLRRQYHMPDLNGSTTTLHWVHLETNQTIQLTRPIWGKHDQQFYWVDDKRILFLSNRGASGLTQIFQLNLPDDLINLDDFLEPIQITDFKLNIDNLLVNRKATRLAFSCQVYANHSIDETYERESNKKRQGSHFYEFDKLFIRHWDEYMTGLRHHPFIASIECDSNGNYQLTTEPKDILLHVDSDSPTRPFGDAQSQWSFSASGDSFAYTRQHDEFSNVSWTTNLDIYTIDLLVTNSVSVCLTCDNEAADTDPNYSPTDENILVYRSQSVPGYESDRYRIMLINGSTSKRTVLNELDRSIETTTWSIDGKSLYVELGEYAQHVIYKITNVLDPNAALILFTNNGTSSNINLHPKEQDVFVYTYQSVYEPVNIYLYSLATENRSLTDHNKVLLSKVRMSKTAEHFSFVGAKNETVWGWHIEPPNGRISDSPLAFLIHGGPQNSWYNSWGYRWNFQSFSSHGYAVIAINFHGSDSYGQNFTDSINGNYGSLPFEDLVLGLDHALNTFTYIHRNRSVALGASYGGYMINWIAGKPQMSKRFRALVNHDGLFDLRGMAYATEELWFTEFDQGKFPQYERPDLFEQYNPVNNVANWTQPMLVIHGALDYRVPETEGISTFTALQRRGIPSRMLFFPNENHWVNNPFNSIVWYQEVHKWMREWTTEN